MHPGHQPNEEWTIAKQSITQLFRLDTTTNQTRTLPYLLVAFLISATNTFLIKLPFLGGRSLTLIFMLLIALEVLSQDERPAKNSLQPWTWLLFLVNIGLLISFWFNMFRTDLNLDFMFGLRSFFAQWYWIVMSVILMRLAMQPEYQRLMVLTLGVGALLLGGFRVFEAVRSGGWGVAGTGTGGPELTAKNIYGILFSNFALFALLLPIVLRGPLRIASAVGVGILVIAILGTGSRGSWAGLGVGAAVFIILYGVSRNASHVGLWFIAGAVIWFAAGGPLPSTVETVVNYQSNTLTSLEDDKSYAYRQVMNQKSRILIEQHPLFGVGLGQFKRTYVPGLVLPAVLRGLTDESFVGNSAHNSYLFLFAEAGLVTMIPFGLFLALLVIEGGKAALQLVRKGELWIIPVYASFISVSIHLWGLSGLGSTGPWLMYGLLAGIILKHRMLPPPPIVLPAVNTARHVRPIIPE